LLNTQLIIHTYENEEKYGIVPQEIA
jgi:hypothetical protein